MTVKLNCLSSNEGEFKGKKRVGRGIGSGKGKTCGRGVKGQKSRSGVAIKGFEGGQMPIHRRLPKRGFNNYNRVEFEVVNVADIEAKGLKGKVDLTALKEAGLIRGTKPVKLLSSGEIKNSVEISVNKVSKAAQEKIEKAGGKVELV